MTFLPRLPPVVRGACRAVQASVPPPENAASPAADAPVAEILAALVETASPEVLQAARRASRARALEEAIDGAAQVLAMPGTLTRRGYGDEPRDIEERAHVAGCRAAGCSGAAARIRPYLRDDHPRIAEAQARHDELLAAEAEWKARAARERNPGAKRA